MKNFIKFILVCLAMLVGMSVSFAKSPEIKKLLKEKQGYNILVIESQNVIFTHVTFGLPPDCWAGIPTQVIHNTPYLLNKCYLNSRPLGQSGNRKQCIFARGFEC